MEIRAVIVEDEKPNQEVLISYLESYCQHVDVVGVASTLAEGIQAVQTHQPDLVFLDIKLDAGNSGFDLLEAVDSTDFQIIFVTAYDEYTKKALNETEAVYYINKPIKISELETAVEKAGNRLQTLQKSNISDELTSTPSVGVSRDELQNLLRQINPDHKIPLPVGKGLELVPVRQIIRCEALGNFVQFFFLDRKKITVYQNLTHYENELAPYDFMRVHRSHLINLRKVKSFQNRGKGGVILTTDDSEIQISAGKKKEFLERLQEMY